LTRMRMLVLAGLSVLLLAAVPAGAVIGGTPDGDAHPYVGLVASGSGLCTGFVVAPTVVVTAAHCAADGETVAVYLDAAPAPAFPTAVGILTRHPGFCAGCRPGLPGTLGHDLAVVELAAPVTLPRYAQLPSAGLSDRLPRRAPLTVVGYGVQGFLNAPGGKLPYSSFERTRATVELNPGAFAWRDEFLRISANKAAVCFGDSGGPNLVGDTVVALNSYANRNCTGNTYSYRLDTPSALAFVSGFLP
jgi:hypothetical protein